MDAYCIDMRTHWWETTKRQRPSRLRSSVQWKRRDGCAVTGARFQVSIDSQAVPLTALRSGSRPPDPFWRSRNRRPLGRREAASSSAVRTVAGPRAFSVVSGRSGTRLARAMSCLSGRTVPLPRPDYRSRSVPRRAVRLRVVEGPHAQTCCDARPLAALWIPLSRTPSSNRMGYRLEGHPAPWSGRHSFRRDTDRFCKCRSDSRFF
jgi:hypothetical protein